MRKGSLRTAMQHIEMKQLPKKLDAECIKESLKYRRLSIDQKDLAIIQFLSAAGPHSSSDEDFRNAVNLSRQPLSKRLKTFTTQLGLLITERASGKATKDLYSLPKIRFND